MEGLRRDRLNRMMRQNAIGVVPKAAYIIGGKDVIMATTVRAQKSGSTFGPGV